MTVAYVCTDRGVPVLGRKGGSVHVQAVLAALQRRGEQVHLVTARPGGPVPPHLADLPVHQVPHLLEVNAPLVQEQAEHRRSEEHTSELQSRGHLVCRLLLEKKKKWSRATAAWQRD